MRDSGRTRLLVATCSVAMGVSACRAQVNASAKVNGSETQIGDDRKWEVSEPQNASQDGPPAAAPQPAPRVASAVASAPSSRGSVPFLGVVHDLSLSSSAPRSAACRCLALAFGPPSDAKFTWQAGPPAGDQDAIAIAIAVDGVACASGPPQARASISAVEHEGTDIVLVVENVGQGRPIMRGALTPSPGPNGAIVVRTRNNAPYPAASGPGPCRIALK